MHGGWFSAIIALSFAAAAAPLVIPSQKIFAWVQFAISAIQSLFAAYLLFFTVTHQTITGWGGWVRLDGLAAYNAWLITLVGALASLYSIGYLRAEQQEEKTLKLRWYYTGLHLFIVSMLAICMSNHPGILWVAVEATTLISALLVAFYHGGAALEAAWKYLITGSVGIALALFGIILLYASVPSALIQENFFWTDFLQNAHLLNTEWVKLSFLFILVGFGTKVGFAPMHFWLPDAHSQAPSPISALLSGVLLQTALFGILRVKSIVDIVDPGFAGKLLIIFGLLSLVVTVPFFLVQHDLKRLLAYSSIEHMGILALGFGLGGTAYLGALLHMFNHAMGKSLLFFASGNIVHAYHTRRVDRIHGVLQSMPITGSAFFIGSAAITGMPPFSLFISEFMIAASAFHSGNSWAGIIFLVSVALIFSGMIYYSINMSFGNSHLRQNPPHSNQPFGTFKSWISPEHAALFLPLALLILFGLYIPPYFYRLISEIASSLQGVM